MHCLPLSFPYINAYNTQIRKAAPLYSKKRQPVLSLMMGKLDVGYDPPAPHLYCTGRTTTKVSANY